MWDKPHLLRMMTIVLVAGSVILLAYSLIHYALQLPVFKLRTVKLTYTPQQVDLNQVNRLIKNSVGGSFFTVDLEKTRRVFEQLPWVRKVEVRRQFPWGLEVTLEEHVPMARWNDSALVNTFGEVFEGQSKLSLPDFNGEPDTAKQLAERYADFSRQLEKVQRSIVQINLSQRYAWQLRLDNGMVLELGREQMTQRLARFVSVYPYSLAEMANRVVNVDMRYGSGFSVYQLSSLNGAAGVAVEAKRKSASRI